MTPVFTGVIFLRIFRYYPFVIHGILPANRFIRDCVNMQKVSSIEQLSLFVRQLPGSILWGHKYVLIPTQ